MYIYVYLKLNASIGISKIYASTTGFIAPPYALLYYLRYAGTILKDFIL